MAQRCERQLRVVGGGFGPPQIVGFDYPAIFQMASAMGISLPAVAELLPIIESAAIPAMNDQMRSAADG